MLNENLNEVQAETVSVHDYSARMGDTGIASNVSANAGAAEVAKQGFQRMRRRYQRAIFASSAPTGWVTRML